MSEIKEDFNPEKVNLKNGYILIEDIVEENITPSGIYLPGDKETYNRFSKVIATGEGLTCNLKPGDIIIKPIGRESKIKLNGKIYGALHSGLIFAKIIEE